MKEQVELNDVQGIILHGYGKFKFAKFLVLHSTDTDSTKTWLQDVASRVTHAATNLEAIDHCINIALTNLAVLKLGYPESEMVHWNLEFAEGMVMDHRSRMLADIGDNDPQQWAWGGPNNPAVHFVLMLYAKSSSGLASLELQEKAALLNAGIQVVAELDTNYLPDRKEHFGFRDGIAQPTVCDAGKDESGAEANNIMPGEFLFGYLNEYNTYTISPTVPPQLDTENLLMPDKNDPLRKDVGRNGSHMVIRQMEQDVKKFWNFMDQAAKTIKVENTSQDKVHLASKMVGRWPNGSPLTKCPMHPKPVPIDDDDNFGYATDDSDGLKCPVGAHVRRMNQRDTFVHDSTGDKEKDRLLADRFMKRFRIIRRGRAYGTPISPTMNPDEVIASSITDTDRGLHFICFGATIKRQFELIQQTWVVHPTLHNLYEDPDPLIGVPLIMGQGKTSTFTEPAQPLRKKVKGIPQFVTVKGGAYFFMPGIRSLQFLAKLK